MTLRFFKLFQNFLFLSKGPYYTIIPSGISLHTLEDDWREPKSFSGLVIAKPQPNRFPLPFHYFNNVDYIEGYVMVNTYEIKIYAIMN